MQQAEFAHLLHPVFDLIAQRKLDPELEQSLNRQFPSDSEYFGTVEQACHAAISAGWMCAEGSEGRRFGRVITPSEESRGLSVDVVDLKDIVGPHHRHPNGEVCMIMPQSDDARFDGRGAGWCVYPPGSQHFPTVKPGEALVLYLLPDGAIEFTGQQPPAAT